MEAALFGLNMLLWLHFVYHLCSNQEDLWGDTVRSQAETIFSPAADASQGFIFWMFLSDCHFANGDFKFTLQTQKHILELFCWKRLLCPNWCARPRSPLMTAVIVRHLKCRCPADVRDTIVFWHDNATLVTEISNYGLVLSKDDTDRDFLTCSSGLVSFVAPL